MTKVLLDARLAIRGLGIASFVGRLVEALGDLPGLRVDVWKGSGGWDRLGRLSTFARSGLFDLSPRLDPRARNHDVVHYTGNTGAVWTPNWSVLTVHDLMHRRKLRARDSLTGFLSHRGLHGAGRVVADTTQTRADVEAAFPKLAGRVEVIPLGMRRLPKPDAERTHVLAFGGGGDPRKRVPLTIAAYGAYRSAAPEPLPLVVLSRAGLTDEQQHQLVGLGARLVPDATRAEVDRLVAGAAAMLYPTAEEGFGLPVLEAAEVGTPVVVDGAARLAPEVVGPHCYQVAGDRAADWGDALRRAIEGGPVYDSLPLPDWPAVAARYAELYEEVRR